MHRNIIYNGHLIFISLLHPIVTNVTALLLIMQNYCARCKKKMCHSKNTSRISPHISLYWPL